MGGKGGAVLHGLLCFVSVGMFLVLTVYVFCRNQGVLDNSSSNNIKRERADHNNVGIAVLLVAVEAGFMDQTQARKKALSGRNTKVHGPITTVN